MSQRSLILFLKIQWSNFKLLVHSPENSITKYGEGAGNKWPRNSCPQMASVVSCPLAFVKGGGVRHQEQPIALAASSSAPCTLRTTRFCSHFKHSHISYYQVKWRTEGKGLLSKQKSEKMEVLRCKCLST